MLKKLINIKNLFKNKTVRILTFILVVLFIWIGLPFIPVKETYPFESFNLRVLVTVAFIFGLLFCYAILFFIKHKGASFGMIKAKLIQIWNFIKKISARFWQYFKDRYHDIYDYFKQDRQHRRLKRLPWYLVIGSAQSGKDSFIQNTGLALKQSEYLGPEAIRYRETFPEFAWHFSDEAVLLDVMSDNLEQNTAVWQRFIKLLKRERRHRPFNGVILTFSLTDLLLYSHQRRQDFFQHLSLYIRSIFSEFKSLVPVYIVFNKVDLVAGFGEFFQQFSKNELSQMWGMSFSLQKSNELDVVTNCFNEQYTYLIERLRQEVIWEFKNIASLHSRELINGFAQEMQIFKKPIENFISELWGSSRYRKSIQLRGIYFTSSLQGQGQRQDFFSQAMSKKFQLASERVKSQVRVGGDHFLQSLFLEGIFSESSRLGMSQRRQKILYFLYCLGMSLPILLVLFMAIGLYCGYQANVENLDKVPQKISDYKINLEKLENPDPDIAHTLSTLDPLNEARLLYSQGNWGLGFLIASYSIKNRITEAEQRTLNLLFWPRVAHRLQSALVQDLPDQNLLYAYLKGYLAFNPEKHTTQEAIRSPMQYYWAQSYTIDSEIDEHLRFYLDFALKSPIVKFHLDQNLINNMRAKLKQTLPSERAYRLLEMRANLSNTQDINFSKVAGESFNDVFLQSDPGLKIPFFFTQKAFKTIFLEQYKAIADEVAEDTNDLGLSSKSTEDDTAKGLREKLQVLYNQHYKEAWDKSLSNVHVKRFSSFLEATNAINLMMSPQSPMLKLLTISDENTEEVKKDKVNVAQAFERLNDYTKNNAWGASWKSVQKVLPILKNYLTQLAQENDQDVACFNAVTAALQGKDNPFKVLNDLASKSPEPLKQWLQELSNESWQVILNSAHQHMNFAWQSEVISVYKTGLQGRYPLNPNSELMANMEAFNTVFGTSGLLEHYFNQYIKPFVVVDKSNLRLYSRNGLSMDLPQATLEVFKKASHIRGGLFSNGAKMAQLNFSIQPLFLDSRASEVQLKLGEQVLEYSHGLQISFPVSWPLPQGADNAQIKMKTFEAGEFIYQSSGTWSLFKILQKGTLTPSSKGIYVFNLNFKGYTASYELRSSNEQTLASLIHLKDYKLPDLIAPNLEDLHDRT